MRQTMTNEERASMRSTWEKWHRENKILSPNCFKCVGRNSRDVLGLLKTLDNMERRAQLWEKAHDARTEDLKRCMADRNYWKAQVEARDKALNDNTSCGNPECGWYGPCNTCVINPDECCYLADEDFDDCKDMPCPYWVFDQERFKGE